MASARSPLHATFSLSFLLTTLSFFNCVISSSFSNATATSPPSNRTTTLTAHYYDPQPVTLTVAANQTEVYMWNPGGTVTTAETFTLTGPTTFITTYVDNPDAYYTYSTTLFTYSVPSGTMSTETLVASVNTNILDGYMTSGNFPWEVVTTFILNGPTVFVTQGVTVLTVGGASPPYWLSSAPASNLDSQTTSSEPAAMPTASIASFPTVFNPQPVSSLGSSQLIMPIPATEPSPSRTPVPVIPISSPIVVAPPDSTSIAPPVSVLNPSAILINSQTILLNSPAITISATPISLASSGLLIGSSLLPLFSQPPMPLASLIAYGYTVSELNPSEVVIGSQTAFVGGPAITISGASISLAESGILVSSSFLPISLTIPTSAAIFTIGSQSLTLLPSAVAFASTTLTVGAPGVTVDGTPVSLGPSDLIIGTDTETLAPTATTSIIFSNGAEGKRRIWACGLGWWSLGFVWWRLGLA